jgi:hypothetical protein
MPIVEEYLEVKVKDKTIPVQAVEALRAMKS